MIVQTDDQSKLEESMEHMNKSYTKGINKHIPTGFTLPVYYSEDTKYRKKN